MKTLIMFGFLVWRYRRHGGMRQIVDSRRHQWRRHIAFHAAMLVRAALIQAGY